jgi:hypothetical protein
MNIEVHLVSKKPVRPHETVSSSKGSLVIFWWTVEFPSRGSKSFRNLNLYTLQLQL